MSHPALLRVVGRLVLGPIVAIAVLLALEGLARLGVAGALRWTVPSAEVRDYIETNRVVFDPELGWRPAAVGGVVDTVWLGLGAADLTAAPPPGRARVFAFGDSQTQGGGVKREEAWPAVTGDLLRARGLDVEVINAGAPGFRSAQVLRLLQTRVLAFGPDVLVVDCRTRDSTPLADARPPGSGQVEAVLFQSRLYRLLWLGLARVRGQDLGLPGADGAAARIEQPVGAAGEGPGNHGEIAALARTWGIDLVFVDYPNRGIDRARILPGAAVADLPAGVPVVNASAVLTASGRPPDTLFFDINHLTVEGNRRVAAAVVDVLAPIVARRTR